MNKMLPWVVDFLQQDSGSFFVLLLQSIAEAAVSMGASRRQSRMC